jgi:hypothetical protein
MNMVTALVIAAVSRSMRWKKGLGHWKVIPKELYRSGAAPWRQVITNIILAASAAVYH